MIAHLNTLQKGGAAASAWRLHDGLLRTGTDSHFVCCQAGRFSDSVFRIAPPQIKRPLISRLVSRCQRAIGAKFGKRAPVPCTHHSDPRSKYTPKDFEFPFDVQLYHLHWVAGMVDWTTTLPWLGRRAPLVWTLHDMNPFMGIWHYEPDESEVSPEYELKNKTALRMKSTALASIPSDRLIIVAPSLWLQEEAGKSNLLGRFTVRRIPYGLDTEVFHPIPKTIARAALGLPIDARIIAFAADSLSDRRKGGELLTSALQKCRTGEFICITAGGNHQALSGLKCINFGRVESERLMALFYSAADMVICPSLQDNLPNTVLESMACGTPVIGTRVGGIPDMIRPGQNGWLISPGSADELATAISNSLDDTETLRRYGHSSRETALKEHSLSTQAHAYSALYSELLSR